MRFRPVLHPDPAGGAHCASPYPLVRLERSTCRKRILAYFEGHRTLLFAPSRLGREHPSPRFSPLGAHHSAPPFDGGIVPKYFSLELLLELLRYNLIFSSSDMSYCVAWDTILRTFVYNMRSFCMLCYRRLHIELNVSLCYECWEVIHVKEYLVFECKLLLANCCAEHLYIFHILFVNLRRERIISEEFKNYLQILVLIFNTESWENMTWRLRKMLIMSFWAKIGNWASSSVHLTNEYHWPSNYWPMSYIFIFISTVCSCVRNSELKSIYRVGE